MMLRNVFFVCLMVATAMCDVSHLFRKPERAAVYQQGQEANAQITRQESDISPDGSYQWSYDTDNGISAQEAAQIRPLGPEQAEKTAQGSFSWTSPEGQPIQISYIADANGYQPQGDLPTPPPIPIAIQRALDYIAANPPKPDRS